MKTLPLMKKTVQMLLMSSVFGFMSMAEVRANSIKIDFDKDTGAFVGSDPMVVMDPQNELDITFDKSGDMKHLEIIDPNLPFRINFFFNASTPILQPNNFGGGGDGSFVSDMFGNPLQNTQPGGLGAPLLVIDNQISLTSICINGICPDPFIHDVHLRLLGNLPPGLLVTDITFGPNLRPGVWGTPNNLSMAGWMLFGLACLGLMGWHRARFAARD